MIPFSDPVLVFTTLIFTMLIAPLVAERLRVPDLMVLLAAGALLGPNGFGVLERNTAVTLFGSVGLLYIMFLAGLEIDLHRFARVRQRTILFGLLTFAIPEVFGTLAGVYILGFDWTTSILLASMFASHTLLAYPIASRLGISRSEPVTVTVGATILTDTLALLVLAVIADSARGINLGASFWAGIFAGMAALVLLSWWGIPRLTRWFFESVTETGGAQFLFVLTTVCGFAYLSHFAKMEPIIGAFLAGAAFNRLIPENSVLMNRVVFAGNSLFIPFFLISVGMLVDLGALIDNPRSWLVAATMVAVVIVTKYVATWLAGNMFGYDHHSRKVMFGLSVVQAAATLAAVLVGYDLKIFDETVLNGTIAMIMVTCPLGSWMVDRHGRALAGRALPSERTVTTTQRILVPVANPEYAPRLLDLAFLLFDTSAPGSIHPLTIVREDAVTDDAVAQAEKLLANCLSHAVAADIPIEPSVRVDLNISDGIIRTAKELRAGVTLVGWGYEKSIRLRIFGTIMENLLGACPARLFFCRLVHPLNTTRRLLLPLPPLVERRRDLALLLRDAKSLARQIGVDIRVYLTGKDLAKLKRVVESARPARPLVFVESESLAETRSRLFAEIADGDTILLPAERRSGRFWTPAMDILPEVLASRFPENDLLIAYPPLTMKEDFFRPETEDTRVEPFILHAMDIPTDIDLGEALRAMSKSAFPHDSQAAARAHHQLLASASSFPIELCPGVVLLHGHCEGLEQPMLILGVSSGTWVFPSLPSAQRILLALLSPKTQSPDRHLKSLAGLARKFHNPEFAQKVSRAVSADELTRVFSSLDLS
jgi:Kef-type K+ transport system membrane component KefB/mannitol/fructose-specific phosphotransferase system IIA component (Ntr-type)